MRAWRAAPPRESAFLLNGWQSFSFAGVLHGAQPQPTTPFPTFSGAFHAGARPPPADAAADARLLTSDWVGALRLGGGGGALAGFLSQRAAFGGVAAAGDGPPDRLLLFAEVGAEVRAGAPPWATDWAVVMPLPYRRRRRRRRGACARSRRRSPRSRAPRRRSRRPSAGARGTATGRRSRRR